MCVDCDACLMHACLRVALHPAHFMCMHGGACRPPYPFLSCKFHSNFFQIKIIMSLCQVAPAAHLEMPGGACRPPGICIEYLHV